MQPPAVPPPASGAPSSPSPSSPRSCSPCELDRGPIRAARRCRASGLRAARRDRRGRDPLRAPSRRRSIRKSPASSRTSPRSAHRCPVTDFDGDGWPDLYFTNSRFGEPNALYHNKGDGTFEDVAASAGLADLNEPGEGVSMGAVWGDIDNDGREDLLVYRYGYLALFRNVDGHHFEDITEKAGLHRWVNSNGAIWIDYDRDGLLDLYVTAYFRSDIDLWHLTTTRIMHNSFEFADQRREEPALPQPRRRQIRGRHRQDGRRQHALDARRRVGRLQRRRLARHLPRQRLRPRGAVPQRSRQAVRAHAPPVSRASRRAECPSRSATRSIAGGSTRSSPTSPSAATSSRTTTCASTRCREADGSATSPRAQIADAGWAWGAQFGDLNNDGANELFVANGFISADRDKSYWYAMSKIAGANGRAVRGRRDLARLRQRESLRLRALARVPQSRRRGLGGRREEGRRDRSVRRPRRRARRSLQSRRGGRDRREPESTGRAVSRLSRQRQPLDRVQARRHAQQPQRDRRRGGARVGRSHAAARGRWRLGLREPERSPAALRARHARVGGSRRHPLALGRSAGGARVRRSTASSRSPSRER